MGHLVLQIHQHLFSYYLAYDEPCRVFCNYIVREVHRSLLHESRSRFNNVLHMDSLKSRGSQYFIEHLQLLVFPVSLRKFLWPHPVNLVDNEDFRSVYLPEKLHNVFVSRSPAEGLIHDKYYRIHLAEGADCGICHEFAQLVSWLVYSRSIDKHHLNILLPGSLTVSCENAPDGISRCLGLFRCYSYLFSQNRIEKRGLAHVRSSYDSHKS